MRNRFHTKTVGALLKVKHGVAKAGGCMKFSPHPGVKELMSSDILYGVSDSGSLTEFLLP